MPLRAFRVDVGTTVTRLDTPTTAPYTGGAITIKNPAASTGPVAVGGADVTAGQGFELEPGAAIVIAAENWSRVYAVTADGTVQVQLLESRA